MGAASRSLIRSRGAGFAEERSTGFDAPMRWAIGYLAVSGSILAVGRHPGLAAAHVALIAVLGWATRSRSAAASYVADFLPIALVIALAYGEVPALVAAIGAPYHDSLIQGFEQRVFGVQPSRALAGALPNLALSELLHAGYMSFYLALSLPLIVLYARRERIGFKETALALMATWVVCCALFALFPVQGPRFLWPAPEGVPVGPFRRLSLAILAGGSAKGTAFPSLHMAASLGQTWMGWRWQPRWVAVVLSISTLLVGIGAVYAGYHYAVDMAAGAVLGSSVTALVVVLSRAKHRVPA